ncbi:MAG: DUF1015 family protein [Ornithinimicrobium sp.]|uniref:DUF1015 family protein n=1 Tax=Ornithinimicrobium sp. TaxID=1977084 RepID=UPI003D9B2DA1
MTAVHPIAHAWISTGGTGAQNYDEFADDAEITTILRHAPRSALGVEMPHRAPDSVGDSFADALPDAVQRLRTAQQEGFYAAEADVVGVYRISSPDDAATASEPAYGVFAMVDTDQISTSAEEPGLVIRNEDVFADKVRERVALLEATEHLLSAVLLLQTDRGEALRALLAQVCGADGEADVRDVDPAGRVHEVWAVRDTEVVAEICALAGGGELVVADGNHRSLAAQTAGLPRFLAVVTTPGSVGLQPYHRLLSKWPVGLAPVPEALRAAGAQVEALAGPAQTPQEPGTIHVHTTDGGYAVRLPVPEGASGVDRLDHALVEQVLLRHVLGWDAGDKRVRYIGGDYPASWLREQVDAGAAAVAVLIAPVRVEDFVAVNLDRERMPRKSTWFTPKARAGLVLADLRSTDARGDASQRVR